MYKNVLIISDNIEQCAQFENIIDKLNRPEVNWTFAMSPFTNKQIFIERLKRNVLVVDLKDENIIEQIILKYDLIFSIHCKQIFPETLVNKVKCINVHPGYNPINRGWYPQVFAIINNLPIGATIHEIDKDLDHGDIIERAFVPKEISDTSETLYNKVINAEINLIQNNIEKILNNAYKTISPENEGNIFLKKDFNKLCELDLNEKMSTLEFINKLRALTHGNYKNAYFIDSETGKKVFVSIDLKKE